MNDRSDRQAPVLLHILELGGYPDFSPLYRAQGYLPERIDSMRKAIQSIKKRVPDVIVAEFNFQSDFRDRTSQLESLMASIARAPQVKVIVFYDREQAHQLERVRSRFDFHALISYPIDEEELASALRTARPCGPVNSPS